MSDLRIAGANLIRPIEAPELQQAGQTGEAGGELFRFIERSHRAYQ